MQFFWFALFSHYYSTKTNLSNEKQHYNFLSSTWFSLSNRSWMIDSSSNILVSILTCFCTDCPSFSFKLYNFLCRANLFAHVLLWNWSANFFQTTNGFSGSGPSKYNSVGSTDSIIVPETQSLHNKYFACSPWFSGAFSFPVIIFHSPSFIRASLHCTFQVA